jgi:uncharacterized repeat protein (TIGR01451 family)
MRILLIFLLMIGLSQAGNAFPYIPGENMEDQTPPTIQCPADAVVFLGPQACTAPFSYTVIANDDTPGWVLAQTGGLASGQAFPLGPTVNTFKVTDTDGNTAACSFKVTVKDTILPVAICKSSFIVNVGKEDATDCYDGAVAWIKASNFNNGSYDDNCSNIKLTIRRNAPFTDCILGLNPVNGHPSCNDVFPDFPSEFERAISEQDSIKFYCCEAGTTQKVLLRVYQMDPDGHFTQGPNNTAFYTECAVNVSVINGFCTDSSTTLAGTIELDLNADCQPDANALGLRNLIVRATDANNEAHYAVTNVSGVYQINSLPAGSAQVEVLQSIPLWQICNNPATVGIAPAPSHAVQGFSAQPTTDCPLMQMDMATGYLRACDTSTWYVSYCNIGGGSALNASVQLVSDPSMALVDASQPYSFQGDTMTVDLGNVAAGECGMISFRVFVDCDNTLKGKELCVEGHIFPDTFCLPPGPNWGGAMIESKGVCNGDSVRFTIQNVGVAPTNAPLGYVIIDDMVIMRTGTVPSGLAPGTPVVATVPATGTSLRIKIAQEPGHPLAQPPSVAVENCNGQTAVSLLNQFSNEDGNPFTGIACREVVSSYDPNEKLAFPTGYSGGHFIDANTRIDYQINFQNTGNDTAFTVVLRDTLSPMLDPGSIRMGAGSHPFTWNLTGKGILEVRFKHILLPDSAKNEARSHGFAKFSIAQKKDNPTGTVISNQAGIYFDINPVVMTNTVWHTIGKDYILLSNQEPPVQSLVRVAPNPAVDQTFVGLTSETPVQIRLVDQMGRMVQAYSGKAPGMMLQRKGLASGLYFIEINAGAGWRKAGKLIWE